MWGTLKERSTLKADSSSLSNISAILDTQLHLTSCSYHASHIALSFLRGPRKLKPFLSGFDRMRLPETIFSDVIFTLLALHALPYTLLPLYTKQPAPSTLLSVKNCSMSHNQLRVQISALMASLATGVMN
jgi:hypothetical protein